MNYGFSEGDILICKKTGKIFTVYSVLNGKMVIHVGTRKFITRAIGQYLRVQSKFIHVRKGCKIPKDLVFYCPISNRVVELKEGSVLLGRI